MSKEKAQELGIKPLAKIRDLPTRPRILCWFTIPSIAIPKAMKMAGVDKKRYWVLWNQWGFSAVATATPWRLRYVIKSVHIVAIATAEKAHWFHSTNIFFIDSCILHGLGIAIEGVVVTHRNPGASANPRIFANVWSLIPVLSLYSLIYCGCTIVERGCVGAVTVLL